MHFVTFTLLGLGAFTLASTEIAGRTTIVASSEAAIPCNTGYFYCGWNLENYHGKSSDMLIIVHYPPIFTYLQISRLVWFEC